MSEIEKLYHNDLSQWSGNKAKSRKDWIENLELVIAYLTLSIESSFWSSIKGCVTAFEIWTNLKNQLVVNEIGTIILL